MSYSSKAQIVVHERALLTYSLAKVSENCRGRLFELNTEVASVVAKSVDDYTCVVRNG